MASSRLKNNTFKIENLWVEADNQKLLKGVNLNIKSGEIHVLMGPNGSGKSTLLNAIMGHNKYKITKGSIKINNKNIVNLSPDKRAKLGLFLGFQHPVELPGVSLLTLLRQATKKSPREILKTLEKYPQKIISRDVNMNLSGGEKKLSEILQMAVIEPKIALLDEIDSGLDIDSLKKTANLIEKIYKKTHPAILLVTHYQRILNYISPHKIHIIANGEIIKSGDKSLALKLEKEGYEKFINRDKTKKAFIKKSIIIKKCIKFKL